MARSSSSVKTQADFTSLGTIVYLMLVLAVIRGIIYAAVVPPWQAPDEPAQFERTRAALSAEEWNNTFKEDPLWYGEIRESLFQFRWPDYLFTGVTKQRDLPLDRYIALYFPTYGGTYSNRFSYTVMGWPLVFAAGQSIVTQLYLVRLNMVIMGAAVVLLAYLTARTIFPRNRFLMLGPPLLILFNPQHTYLLAAVNNGNLTEVLTAAVLFIGVQGFIGGFSWVRIALMLLLSFAAIWTKPTGFFLLVPLGYIAVYQLWRFRQHWRRVVLPAVMLMGLGLFLAPVRLKGLVGQAFTQPFTGQLYFEPKVITEIFYSYWAMPGWLTLRLPLFWYSILFAGCFIAGVGLIKLLLTRKTKGLRLDGPRFGAYLFLILATLSAVGIQVGWHMLTGSISYSQGRSIYPVIIPISIFLVLGWQQFMRPAWRTQAILILALSLFLFDTMVLLNYIIPFFYSRY